MTDFVDILEEQLIAAHGRRQRPAPPWRAGVLVVAAVAAAAVIVAVVIGLSSPSAQQGAPAPAQQAPPQTAPAQPQRSSLAVLNGTTIVGLARAVADELTANGYPEPNVVTNDTTNQRRSTTEIFYEDGAHDEAYAVASCLAVRFDHVHPMNANARALADRAQVAVFVGADKAR